MQIALPSGRFAYGRVLRDAAVAFYSATTLEAGKPPIGSRDYQFVVGVYDDVFKSEECPVVGHDPSRNPTEDWPPPFRVEDPISKSVKIYHQGVMRPATPQDVHDLEPAAVWDYHHIVDRLTGVTRC
jgi:hypothetical protein